MASASLSAALSRAPVRSGPAAVVICEDGLPAEAGIDRLFALGIETVVALGPGAPAGTAGLVSAPVPVAARPARARAINQVIRWASGRWLLVCFAGEYLFYPHCETRGVRDFTEFLATERRRAATAYALDLYSEGQAEGAPFRPEEAHIDAAGWYGFETGNGAAEIYGGLGWRYEEFIPRDMLRVNRPALFLADAARPVREDLTFGDPEYDSLSCPWHASPTIALMSVRRAAAVAADPRFRSGARSLIWRGSERFDWRSDQLLARGMIEPGQWL